LPSPTPFCGIWPKRRRFSPTSRFYLHLLRDREGNAAALGVMERRLSAADWLANDAYSIADIALYAYTHVAHEGDFDLGGFAAVRRWIDRVAMQPAHSPITAV